MNDPRPAVRGTRDDASAWLPPLAGGIVAGATYLAAQSLFAGARGEGMAAPLQRIGAILLGPDAAPPQDELSYTAVTMGLFIHFALSVAYGRLIGKLVRGLPLSKAWWGGAALALVGIYLPNFYFLAPLAFPWFVEVRVGTTLLDHALFGAVAALVCNELRRRIVSRRHAGVHP